MWLHGVKLKVFVKISFWSKTQLTVFSFTNLLEIQQI